ncbi:hypothetical protein [uncultured Clostridium sp.]|uniref:hypothetical protein n=1 Tax=uncultured Clostridium sp. TaxID=59620 RepID=UPI00263B079D|nr:hypothetical protein [uncultured Clostridium sp.]
MSIKNLFISDRNGIKESKNILPTYNGIGPKATDILITDHVTGKPLFRDSNKIVTSGSLFVASKFFDIEPPHLEPYDSNSVMSIINKFSGDPNVGNTWGKYNPDISLGGTEDANKSATDIRRRNQHVMFFALGSETKSIEASQILDVDYNSRIEPDDVVPFIMADNMDSLLGNTVDKEKVFEKYGGFGKRTGSAGTKYCYYFKKFDTDPVIYLRDVTSIDKTAVEISNFYNDNKKRKRNIEVCVELNFSMTKDECRDFFTLTQRTPKITTIELISAYEINMTNGSSDPIMKGHYYENIIPVTKLFISPESIEDATKGLDIVYHVYF